MNVKHQTLNFSGVVWKESPEHRNSSTSGISHSQCLCAMRYSRDKYEAMQIVNDSYMKVLRNIRNSTVRNLSDRGMAES